MPVSRSQLRLGLAQFQSHLIHIQVTIPRRAPIRFRTRGDSVVLDGRRRKRESDGGNWAEDFLKAILDQPCIQLASNFTTLYGKEANFLGQIVWEVPSVDAIWDLKTARELCHFEEQLHPVLRPIMAADLGYEQIKMLKHFWSLPNFAACQNPTAFNCSSLKQEHLDHSKRIFQDCRPHYRQILACRNLTLENAALCGALPDPCQESMVGGLFHLTLSESFFDDSGDGLFLNSLLPIFSHVAYRNEGKGKLAPVWLFRNVQRRATALAANMSSARLVGMNLGVKFQLFSDALNSDVKWGILATVLVIICIWLYSFSFFYTLMVFICLKKSILIAFAVYRFVFGISFFPFMNLLSLVLLIGIGADDTFVLNFIFGRAAEAERRRATPPKEDYGRIRPEAVRAALSHALLSMMVTSLTTAAAFFANLVSDVAVIRCFGLFAGTLILTNFVLVVTWLPASLVLLHRHINPAIRRLAAAAGTETVLGRVIAFFGASENPGSRLLRRLTEDWLPSLVWRLRGLWLFFLGAVIAVAPVLLFYKPGLRLPSVNPLQLFRDSNPMEWYDNNAAKVFPFVRDNSNYAIYAIVAWGLLPNKDASSFDPRDPGLFRLDDSFSLSTLSELAELESLCTGVHALSVVSPKSGHYECWPSKYRRWASEYRCSNSTARNRAYSARFCCNPESEFFDESRHLVPCLQYASKYYSTYWDSLLFERTPENGSRIIGYWLEFEADFHYSGVYDELRETFAQLEGNVSSAVRNSSLAGFRGGFFLPSSNRTAQWLELLGSLVHGTPVSVVASVCVALIVVIVSTRRLLVSLLAVGSILGVILVTVAGTVLLEWRLSVVESTVIILTVGLSFDFTLHYAVGFNLAPPGLGPKERLQYTFEFIGLPVLLSALTTGLAGAAMCPSESNAFHQIGVFMLSVTGAAYAISTFFFNSLLCLLPASAPCPCPRNRVTAEPVKETTTIRF